MQVPLDEEELCPGGMKHRIAFDRMVIRRAMLMAMLVMAVCPVAVSASAECRAVAVATVMVFEGTTVVEVRFTRLAAVMLVSMLVMLRSVLFVVAVLLIVSVAFVAMVVEG